MATAMKLITDKLLSAGMSMTEIDHLLARFLEEEAFDYVDYISEHLKQFRDAKEDDKDPEMFS